MSLLPGVGLTEIYDLTRESQATTVNISTRGLSAPITRADRRFHPRRKRTTGVLIRAIGPSAAKAGVANTLQNPALRMIDPHGNETFTDNWRSNQQSEISATSIAPADDREAAILATPPAGTYTATVAGAAQAESPWWDLQPCAA